MQSLVTQNGTCSLSVVGGIHVYRYQSDVRRYLIQHRHHLLLIRYNGTVSYGIFRKYSTTTIYDNIVWIKSIHHTPCASFPSTITHYVNDRTIFCRQYITGYRTHHLSYLPETMMSRSSVNGDTVNGLAFFNSFHIDKSITYHYFLILWLCKKKNVIRQVSYNSWIVMIDMIVRQHDHIQTISDFVHRHCEMHSRSLVHAKSRLQRTFIRQHRIYQNILTRITDS